MDDFVISALNLLLSSDSNNSRKQNLVIDKNSTSSVEPIILFNGLDKFANVVEQFTGMMYRSAERGKNLKYLIFETHFCHRLFQQILVSIYLNTFGHVML